MVNLPHISLNKIKQIRKLKQKKYRISSGQFICEGKRLFEEALNTRDLIISDLLISEEFPLASLDALLKQTSKSRQLNCYLVSPAVIKSLSDEITPSGILFTVEKKTIQPESLRDIEDHIIIYLENISEPGNLGAIMRNAAWFGIKTLILSPRSVDPTNPKSVRSSAGAIFSLDIFRDIEYGLIEDIFRKKNYRFVSTSAASGQSLNDWGTEAKYILFFGQEANGLSDEITNQSDIKLTIPRLGKIESLNLSVASGIIMYELTKKGQ